MAVVGVLKHDYRAKDGFAEDHTLHSRCVLRPPQLLSNAPDFSPGGLLSD